MPIFEEARTNIEKTTRRGLALYFGTINLAGERVSNPSKILRGIERRGDKVLQQIENNNKQIRRNVTLLQKRTNETASSVRGTARATVGLATSLGRDVDAATPTSARSTRKRSTGRKTRGSSTGTRVAAAGTSTHTVSTTAGATTKAGSRSGSTRSQAAIARQRSQAAQKAARTRALNERKAEAKKAAAVAKAKATRAANESKGTLEKTQERVQHGFQQVGHSLENVGERIERTVEQVAS